MMGSDPARQGLGRPESQAAAAWEWDDVDPFVFVALGFGFEHKLLLRLKKTVGNMETNFTVTGKPSVNLPRVSGQHSRPAAAFCLIDNFLRYREPKLS